VVHLGEPEAFPYVSESVLATVPATAGFESFALGAEPRLRRALCSTFGPVVGREAAVDALAYGWENWTRVGAMANPVGYLYRVGFTAGRRAARQLPRNLHVASVDRELVIEPKLDGALQKLSPQQRAVVVLVHGYGYSLQEAADTLGLKRTTVQNHADRAMARLRSIIGEVTL
jgi:DNA-directed RNA polymerase specialized sigma24 family protein